MFLVLISFKKKLIKSFCVVSQCDIMCYDRPNSKIIIYRFVKLSQAHIFNPFVGFSLLFWRWIACLVRTFVLMLVSSQSGFIHFQAWTGGGLCNTEDESISWLCRCFGWRPIPSPVSPYGSVVTDERYWRAPAKQDADSKGKLSFWSVMKDAFCFVKIVVLIPIHLFITNSS